MGIPTTEIIDLTLSDDEEEVVNTAATAKKPRLENGVHPREKPPQPLVTPKKEKDASEPVPQQSARPRCPPSTSPAGPVSGSSTSTSKSQQGQGQGSVIRYSNQNGVTSASSPPAPAPVAVTVSHSQNNQPERRHKKPEAVATSRNPLPAPATVDKIVAKPGPSETVAKPGPSEPVAKAVPSEPLAKAPVAPSKVIPAAAAAPLLRRPSEMELGPKKGYLYKNSNGPIPSTSYAAVAAAAAPKPTPVITPAAKVNGTAGPEKVPDSSKNVASEATRKPPPLNLSTPTTPSKPSPPGPPVRAPTPAATNNAPGSEPKKSLSNGTDEAIKSPTLSPKSPDSDKSAAPVLERQTGPLLSANLDVEQSAGPPLLTPEVPVHFIINAPPKGRTDATPTLEQRQALIQKFKIPKKATSENSNASSSAMKPKTAMQSATIVKLDTKLFGKQMERVAHQRPKADVRTTLEMSASLIRTVQRLKERIPTIPTIPVDTKVKPPAAIPSTSFQSAPRILNTPPPFRKLLPPRIIAKSNSSKGTNKTPEQLFLLEETFKLSSEPLPTDILELVTTTGLSKPQIQQWFKLRRKKCTDETENTFPDPDIESAHAEDCYDYNDDEAPPATDNQPSHQVPSSSTNRTKSKYLNDLGARTTDLDTIRADIEKVEACPIDDFKLILECMWERKARNIFSLVTGTKDSKSVLLKEARRIKDKFRVDPFSEEQKEELALWKQQFLDKISEEDEKRAQCVHIFDEYVAPWIAPFIYSRVARQDGLLLSLEVAIHDFTRLYCGGITFDWVTPAMISYL